MKWYKLAGAAALAAASLALVAEQFGAHFMPLASVQRMASTMPSVFPFAEAFAEPSGAAPDSDIRIELTQTDFKLVPWSWNGSHLITVNGRLLAGGLPVENAVVRSDYGKKKIATDRDGRFQVMIDRSLLADTAVRVISADEAKVSGKPLDKRTTERLLAAAVHYRVFYPIEVSKVEPSAGDRRLVNVHARIVAGGERAVSFFQVDKYRINGKVRDADGNPVKDAVVWLDRDEGEGFAKSTPADENGEYQLFYLPEDVETNLTVTIGKKRYTLPKGKVMYIPRDTSVSIDITLPREGTVIDDKPPSLVCRTAKGAMYTGIIAGIDVPDGTSYTVTIPDREGRFVLTVPKEVWDRNPTFFETHLTKFVDQEEVLKPGDVLPAGFVTPSSRDPKNIVPKRNG